MSTRFGVPGSPALAWAAANARGSSERRPRRARVLAPEALVRELLREPVDLAAQARGSRRPRTGRARRSAPRGPGSGRLSRRPKMPPPITLMPEHPGEGHEQGDEVGGGVADDELAELRAGPRRRRPAGRRTWSGRGSRERAGRGRSSFARLRRGPRRLPGVDLLQALLAHRGRDPGGVRAERGSASASLVRWPSRETQSTPSASSQAKSSGLRLQPVRERGGEQLGEPGVVDALGGEQPSRRRRASPSSSRRRRRRRRRELPR